MLQCKACTCDCACACTHAFACTCACTLACALVEKNAFFWFWVASAKQVHLVDKLFISIICIVKVPTHVELYM